MLKIPFITFFLLLCTAIIAQQDNGIDWTRWDSLTLQKANTARDTDYLSAEEKKIIFLTNLARLDGQLFIETILDPHLEGLGRTKYTRSLLRELARVRDLIPLKPEKDLHEIAFGHAMNMGKKGTVGHAGFSTRFKPVMSEYNMYAENCSYGYEKGESIVIQLLIDEGVSDLGHRKNMLDPRYNSIGVSIQPHKKYRFNCVMDFGRKIR